MIFLFSYNSYVEVIGYTRYFYLLDKNKIRDIYSGVIIIDIDRGLLLLTNISSKMLNYAPTKALFTKIDTR